MTTDSYLTISPRGLHDVAITLLQKNITSANIIDVQLLGESSSLNASKLSQLLLASKVHQDPTKRYKFESLAPTTCLPVGNAEIVKPSNETDKLESQQKQYASLGYRDRVIPVWSQAGDGDVWVKVDTTAPIAVIANQLRFIGPLLALAQFTENIDLNESQSLNEAMQSVKIVFEQRYQQNLFADAFELWHTHVQSCWSLPQEQRDELSAKYEGKVPMKYRLSCIRSESKKYKYTRQQFLAAVGALLKPEQLFARNNETTTNNRVPWKVDLSNFDVEIVLLVRPHSLVMGLSLRPYLQADALTYATGTIPPDITPPYVPGRITAGFVRLRPTTAQILLHLANLQPGDVVLDPCAGIGTIPIEVMFNKETTAIGLGGDLAIAGDSESDIGSVAASYMQRARTFQNECDRYHGVADLLAWDATNLPFRSGSVDAVVSDLPFGQHCMSATKLADFLPLLFGELARVLRPGNGHMVLLCGSYPAILEALQTINQSPVPAQEERSEDSVWEFPCQSVFPVNIGGLLAWVVHVKRGVGAWRHVPNHRARSRKLVARRDHINKCDPSKPGKHPQQQKFRRVQK